MIAFIQRNKEETGINIQKFLDMAFESLLDKLEEEGY